MSWFGKGLGTALLSTIAVSSVTAIASASQVRDSCSATGSGTTYALHITTSAGSQEYGFEFKALGTSITNAVIPGQNGSFTVGAAGSRSAAAWISDTPLPNTTEATLTTSGAPSGPFTIVPVASGSTFLSAITCSSGAAIGPGQTTFTVSPSARYIASSKEWTLETTVPAGGTVSAVELEPTTGTAGAAQVTATSLVQVRRVTIKTAGTATLHLRATNKGIRVLARSRALVVRLNVAFDASSGKAAHRQVTLKLTR